MTVEDPKQSTEQEPVVFEPGLRVRVAEGEHAGAVGEIAWWGKSKYGPEMRAGILVDDGDAGDEDGRIYVEGTEIRAIDENNDDLEPQPLLARPPEVEKEVRAVNTHYDLGRAIAALRLQRGYPPSKATSARVRLDRLTEAEQTLGCTIPDPIVAYVVSGLGSIRKPGGIVGLTERLLSRQEADTSIADAALLAFDRDDGNYLAFRRGADSDDESIAVCLQEKGYDTTETTLMEWITDQLEQKVAQAVQPFAVVVDHFTKDEPEPDQPEEVWVTHAKFGRGTVVASEPTTQGAKLTVRFTDDGDVRKLLERFITYD